MLGSLETGEAGEEDGVHYHFVDDDTFTQIQQSGGFVEWAHVHSNRYGTSVAEVERLRALGRDVIFEVDFQGGRSLMRSYPDAVSIFVLPPSMAEVRSRLVGRGTDDEAAISLRLNNARVEIATAGEYRYNVTNEVLEHAIEDVLAILRAERLRSTRCTRQIRDLVAEEV